MYAADAVFESAGAGTPKGAVGRGKPFFLVLPTPDVGPIRLTVFLGRDHTGAFAFIVITFSNC